MKKSIILICIIALTSTQAYAISPSDDSEIERDAMWGSKLRDYIYTADDELLEASVSTSVFDLDTVDKSTNVDSVKIVTLSKGPNGQSTKRAGDKFYAVEITLGTPSSTKTKEFNVEYEIELKKDIEDRDEEEIMSEGEHMVGYWEGDGYYDHKTITNSVKVKENEEEYIYQSADFDLKTVITFEDDALFAVEWNTSEPDKNLQFSTDLYEADIGKEKLEEIAQQDYRYIKFKSEPTFEKVGRLVIKTPREMRVSEVHGDDLREIENQWYDSKVGGIIIETDVLAEYVVTEVDVQKDVKVNSEQTKTTETKVGNYSIVKEVEKYRDNPYMHEEIISGDVKQVEQEEVKKKVTPEKTVTKEVSEVKKKNLYIIPAVGAMLMLAGAVVLVVKKFII